MINFIKKLWFGTPPEEQYYFLKKKYVEMSLSEKIIISCLHKIESDKYYDEEKFARQLGCIEGVLLMIGFIQPGTPFEYKKNESYIRHIIRLAKEYLSTSGVI